MINLVYRKKLPALMLTSLLLACSSFAQEETETSESESRSEIRSFDVKTLSAMGREIFRHDQLAWIATDLLMAQVDMEAFAQSGAAGWVVDDESGFPRVRFLRNTETGFEAAYDILFKEGEEPELVEAEDPVLSKPQLATSFAFQTALDALVGGGHPWCGGSPNRVAFPDPDGDGFLVYFLRPKATMEEVPVGGHYRISVSSDGKTVEQIDQLFASCLTLTKNADLPEGGKAVALTMSHIVSPEPVETHVFLSMQERMPFVVICEDDRMFHVEGGMIQALEQEAE